MEKIKSNITVGYILLELCAALNNMCIKSTDNKNEFLSINGIDLMKTMIKDCDRDVKYTCYEILRNCCDQSIPFKKEVRQQGVLTLMLHELENMEEDFRATKEETLISQACIFMKNSTVNQTENCDFIIDGDGFRILCKSIGIVKKEKKPLGDILGALEIIIRNSTYPKETLAHKFMKDGAVEVFKQLYAEQTDPEIIEVLNTIIETHLELKSKMT